MARYKQPYSLTKRGNYWYYRTYTYEGKRTTAKSTGCTSKGAAKKYCDELFLAGTLAHKSIKFKDFASGFFDEDSPFVKDRQESLTNSTLVIYKSVLKKLIEDIGNIKIEDINYIFLKNYRAKLLEKYSVPTVHYKMIVLKIIVNYAFKSNYISVNPFVYLESMHNVKNSRDALTLQEIKDLYQKTPSYYKNNILLLILTGMRLSESLAYEYNSIVQADGYMYYDLKFQLLKKELVPPKIKSFRQIPLIPELCGLENIATENQFVFTTREIIRTFENAEERKLSIHSIRHFFITNAKSFGIPSIKVEYLAGHKLKGIEQVYTNLKAGDCLEILDWQKSILNQILQP